MVICAKCAIKYDPHKPDPCLGFIPGVIHACCGHGIENDAYVAFGTLPSGESLSGHNYGDEFLVLRRKKAIKFFDLMNKAKNDPEEQWWNKSGFGIDDKQTWIKVK